MTLCTRLRIEHHRPGDVLALNTDTPRLSWIVESAPDGWQQTGYDVEINGDTTHVDGADQVLVPWPGAPLHSRDVAHVRVRVTGTDGTTSDWSERVTVEAGLRDAPAWTGGFVEPADDGDAPVLSGRITIDGDVAGARLYITAHGLHRAHLNGIRVGDDELAPGWTSYHHRLRYQAYDVTDLVRRGGNTVDVALGNGWFRGRLGFTGQRAQYGDTLALLAQLEVTTADGAVHVLATGPDWTCRPSNIDADDLYDGQRADLRRPPLGDPAQNRPVRMVDRDPDRLVAPDGPPVRVTQVLPAVGISTSPSGRTLVDFGQNAVGRVRLTVRGGRAGDEVTVRHAEVLEDGELSTRPLRSARATDHYVLSGAADEVCEPVFTFHGFRYAEITGVGDLQPHDVELVVLGSDLERTGWFDSSHELLNRFHENVVWGMRGNFLDVPTDCPQRDERLGWTGDIQAFAPTASFLFDCAGFLTNWLADLAADQQPDGTVPWVVPDVLRGMNRACAAWGDAATFVPTTLYERFGDVDVLIRQLDSMRGWVDRMASLSGADLLWSGGFQFGDWLDPAAPPDDPADAAADPDVLATAYFARSAQLLADAARTVGDEQTAQRYGELADRVRGAYDHAYVTPSGRIVADAATLYAQALMWDLLDDPARRAVAGDRLVDLVRTAGHRIATGFVGTPLMCDALEAAGALDTAYRLLLQTGCPSWLYPVTMGATTVWERWDSLLPDGAVNPGEMTSFNHYALGAVADWLHRTVAGLAPAEPGYRRIRVRPRPGGGLTHASARHLTPYGPAEVGWRLDGLTLTVTATVPVGTRADVDLPDLRPTFTVGPGQHEWTAEMTPPPTGAPSTVREVIDDETLWDELVSLAVRTGVADGEATVARVLRHSLDEAPSEVAHVLIEGRMHGDRAAFTAGLPDALRPRPGSIRD